MENTYSPGHPWHYVLGGRVLYPKEIRESVRLSGYQGYLGSEIESIDKKAEPERSAALRKMKDNIILNLNADISRYREVVRELHVLRSNTTAVEQRSCEDVHVSVSLKYNHIYNGFAHLIRVEDLLSKQPDLFDF